MRKMMTSPKNKKAQPLPVVEAAPSTPAPKECSKRRQKNVSTKQCIVTIIGSLIALLVLLVPVDFVNMKFAFASLPFIGDGSMFVVQNEIANGLGYLAPLSSEICALVGMVLNYATYAYVGILALNILFSLILIITRSVIARSFFKVLSIIFGILMIAIAVSQVAFIGGFIGLTIASFTTPGVVTPADNGILFVIAVLCVSIVMVKRQFNWFSKWY